MLHHFTHLLKGFLPWRVKGFLFGRPRSTVSNIFDLCARDKIIYLSSDGTFKLKKPILIDNEFHNVFNENLTLPTDKTFILELINSRVYRKHYIFSVIDRKHRLLSDLSIDPLNRITHPIYTEEAMPKPIKLKGKTIMLATLGADNVYYHWMYDLLPRIGLLSRAKLNVNDFDHILINPIQHRFQLESLRKIGIDECKLRFVGEDSHYLAENMIVPSLLNHHPSSVKFLRRTFMEGSLNIPFRKIFIKRENSEFRNIINQDEVSELLKRYDFEEHNLSNLSIQEQVKLFNEAAIVLAVHGAGLTNIMFCSPEASVIELSANNYKNVDYWLLSNNFQLNYHVLFCDTKPVKAIDQHFNVHVNVIHLERHIQYALKKQGEIFSKP